ncbi:MAG: prepilin-type N-terminal cleavage/methylation domain-containing protein [Candidatus Omnitrophica bacterium]|nr:prepilin-type N-terminal cleavage/methylation domain-containing protein [Candidatus Omnitrophota bacterium]MDD5236226.1 prepilin-type N-terminal cleavage/methylation domain-containing protein [Candidatus Omnitrophota bacterium]MDD5611108.1 prepilin-type N-terminal cleavage/methylation domain-containing protein [Candidatus Omnitrophota bacterium]
MRKGFTLLELLIVIMIIGVLATVAMVQYNRMSERARASEAKIVLAHIRSAELFYYERWDNYTDQLANLAVEDIPIICSVNSFFNYSITSASSTGFVINATRCTTNGKSPNAAVSYSVSINQSGEVVSPFH